MLSRGHDVIENDGGKVVGWIHEEFLLIKPGLPTTSDIVSFQNFRQI
jgi:hypothetical protein